MLKRHIFKNINILFVQIYSISALAFAYYFQYFENYPPCELCIYQRIPYYFSIILILIYFVIPIKDSIVLKLLFLAFISSFVVSGFHFGVENDLWEYKSACSSGKNNFDNINDLRSFLEEAPIIKCDEVILSFWGVSMATLNMLLSFLMSLFILYCVGKCRM